MWKLYCVLLSAGMFSGSLIGKVQAAVEPSAAYNKMLAMDAKKAAVLPADNAFIYMMGIYASEFESPMAYGQRLIDWHLDTSSDKSADKPRSSDVKSCQPKFDDEKQFDEILEACQPSNEEATCQLSAHQTLATTVLLREITDVERYKGLLRLKQYHAPVGIDAMNILGKFFRLEDLQSRYFAELIVNRDQYTLANIRQALEADYQFQIMRLKQENKQSLKEFAKKSLINHYYWLNELLKVLKPEDIAEILPSYLKQPLPNEIFGIDQRYLGELLYLKQLLQQSEELGIAWLSEDEKQVLLNDFSDIAQSIIALSQIENLSKLLTNYEEKKAEVRHKIRLFEEKLSDLSFPEEQIFSIVRFYPYEDLTAEQSQVASYHQLMQGVAQWRQAGITAEQIPMYLEKLSQENTLSSDNFHWEASKSAFVMESIGMWESDEFYVWW